MPKQVRFSDTVSEHLIEQRVISRAISSNLVSTHSKMMNIENSYLKKQVESLELLVKSLQGQAMATQKMTYEQVMALQSQLESSKAYIAHLEHKVASQEEEKGVQSPATESTGHMSLDSK
ncbi:hypothetical protein MIR68_002199 [Amoeboaphelidium protococcarum]|nr:hypothetical protein MIR68_002199 [Amoeboaphelidium protococcarum]